MNEGPITRSRNRGDIIRPCQKSWLGKTLKVKVLCAWNDLPHDIRIEANEKAAKAKLKNLVLA